MKRRTNRWLLALTFGASLGAAQNWSQRSAHSAAAAAIFPAGSRPAGYKLGLLALSCWLGGPWSDAEAAPKERWPALDEQRCNDLVATVYGKPDRARFEQIREAEAGAVGDLVAKIRATAPKDGAARTAKLFSDVAAAAHEGMLARRSADRVKIDYDAEAAEAKLTDNQKRAAKDLGAHVALDRLLVVTDPKGADRRAIGQLMAMDRMEIARGLPKQLKFYAVGAPFNRVFDAPPPPLTLKPTTLPTPGAWLAYLTDAASKAGHAPPAAIVGERKSDLEHAAWAGVMGGFEDRLRKSSTELPADAVPELSHVLDATAARLASERAAAAHVVQARAVAAPGPGQKQ